MIEFEIVFKASMSVEISTIYIRSHKHEIFTEEINKVALSGNDDKRIIMEDRIRTLAYGHYSNRKPEVKQ